MAMARQFFDLQKSAPPGASFSPTPIHDLVSRQLPLIPASPSAAPNFNAAWAEIHRAPPGLPQNSLSSGAWASEFNSASFGPGPMILQNGTPANCTFV